MQPSLPHFASRQVPLATTAARGANVVSFTLITLGALAQAWALVRLAQALGTLLGPGGAVGRPLLQALACALAGALLDGGAQVCAGRSACHQEAALRRRILAHLFTLGPARSARERTGSAVSLLTDGVERVAAYRQTFLAPTIAATTSPLVALCVLGTAVDWVVAVVLGVMAVATPVLILVAHRRLRSPSSASRRARSRLAADYLDALQGLTTLVLARAAHRTREDLVRRGEDNRQAAMGLLAGNQLVILATDTLFSLLLVTGAAGLAAWRLSTGALDAGGALAIVLVSYLLLGPLNHVGAFFYVGMSGLANQRAIRRVLAAGRPDAGTAPSEQDLPAGDDALSLTEVSAGWEPQRPPVLHDVNLSVPATGHLAVVGPSGAGKSTLVALLAGDLLPSHGTVQVAGHILDATTQDAVRAASAVVAQSTWLFSGTIADNLRLAAPQAGEDDMWQALETVGLAAEVRRMPGALGTVLGERGTGLSGGQAQRLSLARAILADRPVLLLDEPTSQVDLASEAAIIEAIPSAALGRTVVTVSHRAGALLAADRVVEVHGGTVHGHTEASPAEYVDPPELTVPIEPAEPEETTDPYEPARMTDPSEQEALA